MKTRTKPERVAPKAVEGGHLDAKRWRAGAIDPRAYGGWYGGGYTANDVVGGIAIVSVCGPLDHHSGWWLDSYDSIVERLAEAFESKAAAVVICFDSPGGDASGVEEAHRVIKRMRVESGKPLFAYSNESCYSAAYWLACAADEIWLPPTGGVGSVGVIAEAVDVTGMNEKQGVRIELITSGEQKADGHPERPLTDDIVKRVQARVNKLASIFFASVGESRALKPAAVAALQAGTFLGSDAVDVGLADGIAGFDDFLENVRSAVRLDGGNNRATMETRMAQKLLSLTAAVTAAQKALAAAKTDDEQAKAAKELAEAIDAKVKYSKRTRTDELEEDDGSESSEGPSTQRSSEPSSSGSGSASAESASASAEGSASAEAESADEDAEGDDAKKMKSRAVAAMRSMRRHTAAAVYDALVDLTGKRNLNEAVGALAGIKATLASHAKLAGDVEKIKRESREARISSMLRDARQAGKISKAEAKSLAGQNEKWLKGYLASLPKGRLATPVDGGPTPPRESNGVAMTSFASLDAESRAMIETSARAAGMSVDKYFEQFQAMAAKMGNTGAGTH